MSHDWKKKGSLHGNDYWDKFEREMKPGPYSFKLRNTSDKGNLTLRIRYKDFKMGNNDKTKETWEKLKKIEIKRPDDDKITEGGFDVPQVYYPSIFGDHRVIKKPLCETTVEFKFSRPVLGSKVDYEFDYDATSVCEA